MKVKRRLPEIRVAYNTVNPINKKHSSHTKRYGTKICIASTKEAGDDERIFNTKEKRLISNLLTPKCSSQQPDYKRYNAMLRSSQRLSRPIYIKNRNNRVEKNVPVQMDWDNYHRLATIHKFLQDLELSYPSLCTAENIGRSLEGRDIKVLKISNSNATNFSVWIDSGIHAREWIGPAVSTYIANHIAKNFSAMPESVTNKDWYFLPVLNPDGYEYSHTDERLWRKNRAWFGGKCVGVDLNRNFSYGWGGKGSSDIPTNCFYRGPEPFSEPESSAFRDMMMQNGDAFKVYITLHSYGEVIIFPFASRDDFCPGYIRLLNGAAAMSKAIYETNGNTYKVGISKDMMYKASGTSNDWCHGVIGIPYCYLIELRSKKHKFKPPKEEIEETAAEILNCVKALMEFVDKYPLDVEKEKEMSKPKRPFNSYVDTVVLPVENVFFCFLAINIWKEEPNTLDIMVAGPKSGQIAGMLHERDIPYAVAISDVNSLIEKENNINISKSIKRPNAYKNGVQTMDWKNYHRLDTIYSFMNNLVTEFPYLCSVEVIGKSVEGRDLLMLKISNGNTGNPGVWLDGSIHPREWISTAVVTYIADWLVRSFHEQPDSVTDKDWYILPVLNPDGYEYTHTHDRMWRKNRAHYGGCIGVDLNRNFSHGFGENGEEGSSADPGNIFYRGPEPFSEPETEAVRRVIMEADSTFKIFLSFHSYGEVIIFPWGYTDDPCPNYVELLEGGTEMAKAIFETSGKTYKVGSTKDLMYYSAGTSIDWSYAEANIPFSYMIELRGKKEKFLLSKEEIVTTALEILSGITKLVEFVDRRSIGTQSQTRKKQDNK